MRALSELDAAEAALAAGRGLTGTGFWGAVAEVKRSPELVDRYADRIALIDQRAFDDWVLLKVPLRLGTLLALLATAAGLGLVVWTFYLEGFARLAAFGGGAAVLMVATHGLAHLLVGRLVGINFTCWFVGTVRRPNPGVKVDYSSYLRTEPGKRALMHASGAIVTKLIPFALIPVAIRAGLPPWVSWGLIALGVFSILTDVLWSTKSSDWKKVRRELAFAEA